MFRVIWIVIFFSMIVLVSNASSVTVSTMTVASFSGGLQYIYYETSSGPGSTTPGTNTALSSSSSSGSYSVPRGTSAYLWSPQFASARIVPSGTWTVDFWVASTGSGPMSLSIVVTTSSGTITSTLASNVATSNIGTSKIQVVTNVAAGSVSIPANGYLNVILTAPTGAGKPGFTIYWGVGQPTNFQSS